ncbi:hypothetical protein N0V90_010103 [Kalmusia sp. IMI 367209]|nr:hypothetical protein N0V90_010103 [Kalmusia sp. IMI 367209]
MVPTPSKILVFGATGVIGKYILHALINAQSNFDKIGIFTSPGTAEKKKSEIDALREKGVDVAVGDVESEADVKKAYEGYDTVISALGRNAILVQIPLLRFAESSSTIHTFFPSEYGTDIEYFPHSATEKPHQLKLQVRKYIREEVKKLNVTYLVTGPYSDLYISKQTGDFENAGSFDDVGVLLVAALKTPPDASPRTLKVNSFTATPDEILKEFEKQTGQQWEAKYTLLEELKKFEDEAWKKGDPKATGYTLRRIWTEGGTLYEKKDNWRVGEPEVETLESQVKLAIEKQGGKGRL